MKKKHIPWLLGGAFMTLSATTAIAAPSLEAQVQILIRQNQEQSLLIKELQEQMQVLIGGKSTTIIEAAIPQETSPPTGLIQHINDHVQLSGLIEVEASSVDDYGGNDSSDITLATVELGINAQISTLVNSHITLLYEEGEEDDHLIVDEGSITIGNVEQYPIYGTAGKMYVPFGHFDSNMISDPLTLEIGETSDTGLLIGFESGSFYGAGYGFNGDIQESGDDDAIERLWVAKGSPFLHFFISSPLQYTNNKEVYS
jgi:hypothetical protein